MKQDYIEPICEQVVLFTDSTLLQNSIKGEGYGESEPDDYNWN